MLKANTNIADKCCRELNFYVYCNTFENFNYPGFKKIDFNTCKSRFSHLLNYNSNVFAAPEDGVYSFIAGARVTGVSEGYAGLGLFINDKLHTMMDYVSSEGGMFFIQGSASLYLSAGDNVDLRSVSTPDSSCYLFAGTTAAFIWFSGFMILKV